MEFGVNPGVTEDVKVTVSSALVGNISQTYRFDCTRSILLQAESCPFRKKIEQLVLVTITSFHALNRLVESPRLVTMYVQWSC